jgi:hypothetical protein
MKSDKQSYQVKLWAIVGPLICLFSLFVISIKNSQVPYFLPFTIFIGMPICWRWHLWGWGGMTAFLVACLAYEYPATPLEEHFWLIGMGVSSSLSLLITALSFTEVEKLIDSLGLESRSRLENLWKLDEKKQAFEKELLKRKEEVNGLQMKLRSFKKLVDISTEEMEGARSDFQKAQQEIERLKRKNERLAESVRKMEGSPPLEAKYHQLRDQFQEKSEVLDQTRQELFIANEKYYRLQLEYDEVRWLSLSEVEKAMESHILELGRELEEKDRVYRRELDALQSVVDSLLLPCQLNFDKGAALEEESKVACVPNCK